MMILVAIGVFGIPTLQPAKTVLTRMSGHAEKFVEKVVLEHLTDIVTVGKMGKKAWDGKPKVRHGAPRTFVDPTTFTPKFKPAEVMVPKLASTGGHSFAHSGHLANGIRGR